MKTSLMMMMMILGMLCSVGAIEIKSGEKVAFLGDSITQQGNYESGYVSMVDAGLKANGISMVRIPSGVSGNKSNDMLKRLPALLEKKPNVLTLSCGVNDVWHGARGVSLEDYKKNITEIVDQAQKAGVKVYILTATMITEDANASNNRKLVAYNDFLRTLAREKGCVLVDLNADMQSLLASLRKQYPGAKGNLLTNDGVHMAPLGNEMMALGILKGFGLTPEELTKAEQAWQKLRWNWGPVTLTVAEYRALFQKAAGEQKELRAKMTELIRAGI